MQTQCPARSKYYYPDRISGRIEVRCNRCLNRFEIEQNDEAFVWHPVDPAERERAALQKVRQSMPYAREGMVYVPEDNFLYDYEKIDEFILA